MARLDIRVGSSNIGGIYTEYSSEVPGVQGIIRRLWMYLLYLATFTLTSTQPARVPGTYTC